MSTPDYSVFPWVPEIVYTDCGSSRTLTFTLPQRLWRPTAVAAVGGWDESASGVIESRVFRHDRGLLVTVRFFEDEWNDVETALKTIMAQGQSFTYQLDKADAATLYTVRLVAPQVGEAIEPVWNDSLTALELELHIRTADGSQFTHPYNPRS